MQQDIFQPVFAMLLLTFAVWITMYARRIPFLRNSDIPPNQITPAELDRISPSTVRNPSDNLKNLFELPVIFYVLAIYLFLVSQVDSVYLISSWIFVTFRMVHSLIHCTVNIVLLRFGIYVIASLALWFMVVRAALDIFT